MGLLRKEKATAGSASRWPWLPEQPIVVQGVSDAGSASWVADITQRQNARVQEQDELRSVPSDELCKCVDEVWEGNRVLAVHGYLYRRTSPVVRANPGSFATLPRRLTPQDVQT